MANMIADGLGWLNGQLAASASETVTYHRGVNSVSIAASFERPRIDPLNVLAGVLANRDPSQPSPKHVDHRFFFNAAELVISGVLVEPQDGDTISTTVNTKTATYILMAPLDGGPSWSYVSGYEGGDAGRIIWNGRLKSLV